MPGVVTLFQFRPDRWLRLALPMSRHGHGVDAEARHAGRRADRAAFGRGPEDGDTAFDGQLAHPDIMLEMRMLARPAGKFS